MCKAILLFLSSPGQLSNVSWLVVCLHYRTSEANIADLAQLFGGRTFGDVNSCYSSNADDLVNPTRYTESSALERINNGSCTTQLFQDYFDQCWDGEDLKNAANGRGQSQAMKCRDPMCQEIMLNMYACFRYGNHSMSSYQLAAQCKDPPPSKSSFDQVFTMNPKDSSTFLTQDEHRSLLHMRWCFAENCTELLQRVLFQSLLTILFTAVLETLFETGINRCSRSFSNTCMLVSWSVVDLILFFMAALIVHRSVDFAMNNFKQQGQQRCIYANISGFKLQVVIRYFPVLGLTWFMSLLTLLVKEWMARRRSLLLESDVKEEGSQSLEMEPVTTTVGNENDGGGGVVELQSNPMKRSKI